MRDYSKDFAEWRKWRDEKGLPPIYDNPADAGIETDFRVGQQVSFTNEYGVRFEPHVIMGFIKDSTLAPYIRNIIKQIDDQRRATAFKQLTLF